MDNELKEQDLFSENKPKMPTTTNVILVMLVIVAAFASVGELKITYEGAVKVSLLVIFLYIICSVMYSSRYNVGIENEKNGEEYKCVKAEYEKALRAIYDGGLLSKIPEFCQRYRENELKNRRSEILGDQCIPYEIYIEKYHGKTRNELEGMNLSKEVINCIVAANRVKGMNISGNILMSSGESVTLFEAVKHILGFRPGIGMEAKTRQRIDLGYNMVSRFVTTFFAGAVGISIVIDRVSWQLAAQWVMRMFPIAWSALVGYNAGARNVRETLIPQLQRKTSILQLFVMWGREACEKDDATIEKR